MPGGDDMSQDPNTPFPPAPPPPAAQGPVLPMPAAPASGVPQPYPAYPGPQAQQPFPPGYGQPFPSTDHDVIVPGERLRLPEAGDVRLASMGSRLVARLIDGLITSVLPVGLIVLYLAFADRLFDLRQDESAFIPRFSIGVALAITLLLIMAVIPPLYEWLMVATRGATLGKMLMGIRVLDQRTGGEAGYSRAAVRVAVLHGSAYFCALMVLVVMLSPLFDSRRRQGWHDQAAGTVVISVRGQAEQPPGAVA
ncbi:RDD family protein [Pseudonocardiaceae bacterium YIM PH 21723]|nr:RDD family protein [Pseudonocardiaceae bacterium YIM PH 21723]